MNKIHEISKKGLKNISQANKKNHSKRCGSYGYLNRPIFYKTLTYLLSSSKEFHTYEELQTQIKNLNYNTWSHKIKPELKEMGLITQDQIRKKVRYFNFDRHKFMEQYLFNDFLKILFMRIDQQCLKTRKGVLNMLKLAKKFYAELDYHTNKLDKTSNKKLPPMSWKHKRNNWLTFESKLDEPLIHKKPSKDVLYHWISFMFYFKTSNGYNSQLFDNLLSVFLKNSILERSNKKHKEIFTQMIKDNNPGLKCLLGINEADLCEIEHNRKIKPLDLNGRIDLFKKIINESYRPLVEVFAITINEAFRTDSKASSFVDLFDSVIHKWYQRVNFQILGYYTTMKSHKDNDKKHINDSPLIKNALNYGYYQQPDHECNEHLEKKHDSIETFFHYNLLKALCFLSVPEVDAK